MLQTPHTTSWELSLDIFNYPSRPCRAAQETIWDYQPDGRPQFQWEYFRQLWIFNQDPRIIEYCESCPINIMGEVEGHKAQVENLDIFFRAINELAPESLWTRVSRDGTPTPSHNVGPLLADLLSLKERWGETTWPTALPKVDGQPYRDLVEDEDGELVAEGPLQLYAWNGEGPPGLIFPNEGYTLYLSRHGIMVKPTGQDPAPYVFRRLWREDLGVFGEAMNGEQVGFDVLVGRYPTWGSTNDSGTELVFEARPAAEVFGEVLDMLQVFCSVAQDFETGFLIRSPSY